MTCGMKALQMKFKVRYMIVEFFCVVGDFGLSGRKWWLPSSLLASNDKKESFMLKCEDGTSVLPWLPPSRDEQKKRLKSESFDILVIGGGATGSGVAMDAASRGLKTAMVSFETCYHDVEELSK